jgi:hypothetical protein
MFAYAPFAVPTTSFANITELHASHMTKAEFQTKRKKTW